MPTKERNRSIDILRAIAIVLVVIGHSFPVPGCEWWQTHFSAGSYRMALFLFISGYLFKDMEWKDFGSFLVRKTRSLLIPLIGWNIAYAAIVSIINLRHPAVYLPPTSQIWNWHDLLVEPFVGGHQYLLNLATWFVGLLYLTLIIYSIIYLLTKRLPAWALLLFYTGIAALSLYGATVLTHSGIWLVVMRIGLAIFFIQLGSCFRRYIEPILKSQYLWLVMLVLAGAWCWAVYGGEGVYYIWSFMNFSDRIVQPILAGALGCMFWMVASKQIALLIPKNRVETAIGNGTWSIMTNHLLVRFLFCWAFVHFFHNDDWMREAFSRDFWFFPRDEHFLSWYTGLYVLAITLEVAIPVFWQIYFDKFKAVLTQTGQKWIKKERI